MKRLGIDLQTVLGMPPVAHVNLAADLGCGHISTGLTPVPWKLDCFPTWSLRDDASLRRDMIAIMRDRDVMLSAAEGFAIRPNVEVRDRAADLDIVAELGASRASTVSMEPDMARLLDQLAILAEMTTERGMGLTLEFAPPHPINTLDMALAAISKIGRPNVRLVIDAMHFFRSGGTLEQLASLDPERIGYVQMCDVALTSTDSDYYQQACFERKIPGDGELPLRAFVALIPDDVLIGLEIPMLAEAEGGVQLRALMQRAVEATRGLFNAP